MIAQRTTTILILAGLLAVSLTLSPAPLFPSAETPPETPGNVYQSAYSLYRQAERLFHQEEAEGALEKYRQAEKLLTGLQATHPDWRLEGVSRKLADCRKRIEPIEEALHAEKAWEIPLIVHFLDVGHGDCALIQCPDGTNILVDGGNPNNSYFIKDYLWRAGVRKIDLLIATHPHSDHIGGLIEIIENFPVKTILDSGKVHTSRTYQNFLEAVKASPKMEYKHAIAGDKFNFGEVELTVFHPSSHLPKKINNCSIVFRLTYGSQSFLFTGDAEKEAENQVMSHGYPLKSDVLKIGHHGSKTSTTPRFLSAVSPRAAVISKSSNLNQDILRKLATRGTKTYWTHRDGTIVFLSNGKEYRVELPSESAASPN